MGKEEEEATEEFVKMKNQKVKIKLKINKTHKFNRLIYGVYRPKKEEKRNEKNKSIWMCK